METRLMADEKKTKPNDQDCADDPRSVSDDELREEFSREEVEAWRKKADKSHANWFSVMNNPYGKD